jgi:hypothetical protein
MTRGVAHPQELRAQVVAAVLAGTTIMQAARQYGLSKQTISDWLQVDDVRTLRTQKIDDLQTLIERYLEVGFRAMITQAEVLGDPEYCRRQEADKLAIAHGVLGDKLAGVAATAQALGIVGVPDQEDEGQPQLDAPAPSAMA